MKSKPPPPDLFPSLLLVGFMVALLFAGAMSAATVNVQIKDNVFNPKTLSISVGDTVQWTNQGAVNHTATSGSGCLANGLFDSGTLPPGASYSFTFTAAGSVPYFCKPHCSSGMTGTLTVNGAQPLSCSASATPASGEAPLMVTFSAAASGGTGPYAYDWTFGDGDHGSGASVFHAYTSPGTFGWSLTITDGASQTCLQGGSVTVTEPSLSCSAAVSLSEGAAPLTVDFMGTASGGTMPYAFAWDFGDGENSTLPNPQYTYFSAGIYHWTLGVTDSVGGRCEKAGSVTATSSAVACDAAASPSVGAPPLPVVFSSVVMGGTPPYTYSWDFGDGATGAGNPASHTYAGAGTYAWSVVVSDAAGGSCRHAGSVVVTASVSETVLSTVARIAGNQGTDWRTDAMLFNPSPSAVDYDLVLTRRTENGGTETLTQSGLLGGHEAPLLSNLVETSFGLQGTAGSLRVVSDGPLKVTSRTYNQTGRGTYGQFVPGRGAGDGLQSYGLRTGDRGFLIGLQHSGAYRTNLGVTDLSGIGASVRITLRDAAGESLVEDRQVSVPPFAWVQLSLSDLGLSSGEDLRAEVEVDSGAVLAYASVADNGTGDAVYLPVQKVPLPGSGLHQLVAAAAKAKGGFGTDWTTDLALFNPGDGTRTITLEFRAGGQVYTAVRQLAKQTHEVIRDLVGTQFPGAGSNAAGSLHLRADGTILGASRTFNTTEEGTYGQFIPSVAEDDCLAPGQKGQILQVVSSETYRCNLGFSEFSDSDATVALTLYDVHGNAVVTTAEPLIIPAGTNVQAGLEQVLPGAGIFEAGRVEVTVLSGGRVAAYASVADNRTGDAIFIPAQP